MSTNKARYAMEFIDGELSVDAGNDADDMDDPRRALADLNDLEATALPVRRVRVEKLRRALHILSRLAR